jgi:hypothetical protein
MAAMTPERCAIRKQVAELAAERSAVVAEWKPLNDRLAEINRAIRELQRAGCQHPAMKHGSAMGMGWSDCPDCGWSST